MRKTISNSTMEPESMEIRGKMFYIVGDCYIWDDIYVYDIVCFVKLYYTLSNVHTNCTFCGLLAPPPIDLVMNTPSSQIWMIMCVCIRESRRL